MPDLFQLLKPFIFPKYLEEGPPRHVQSMLLGDRVFLSQFGDNKSTRTILELMTFGYRPVTSMAVLKVIEDSNNRGLHGMEVARELEHRFGLEAGYFTRGRFYTDRVGKALTLLVRLGLLEVQDSKSGNGGRKYPAYRIEESSREIVKSRLNMVTNGEQLSIFAIGGTDIVEVRDPTVQKTCPNCQHVSRSPGAVFCDRCRTELNVKCPNCGAQVLAHFRYCNQCRSQMTILVNV